MEAKKVKIIPITPVFIGDGNSFSSSDYFFDNLNKCVCLYDDEKILNSLSKDQLEALFQGNLTINQCSNIYSNIIQKYNLNKNDFIDYKIPSTVNPEGQEIRKFIRNGLNEIYIPGSTLKGAIRTSLICEFLIETDFIRTTFNNNYNSRIKGFKDFFKHINSLFFSKIPIYNPFYDIFKTIIVRDSNSFKPEDSCIVNKIYTYSLRLQGQNRYLFNKKKPVLLETLNTNLENIFSEIIIKKDFVFNNTVQRKLSWNRYSEFFNFLRSSNSIIKHILEKIKNFYLNLIDFEISFSQKFNIPYLEDFYTQLKNRVEKYSKNEYLLRIGYGTGFLDKTVMIVLKRERPRDFMDIIKRIKPRNMKVFYPEFPKTRKLVIIDNKEIPLGWIKIKII
ncbi:MAG: type III-A CRISPR-associated RAMP protein Csm5 [Promethearchaeia archaeon]